MSPDPLAPPSTNEEAWLEVIRTATGMRNAGAERSAVLARLVEAGFDEVTAQAHVDHIDAEMALHTGDRPVDMRSDIVEQADQLREAKIERAAQPDLAILQARRVDRANKMIANESTVNEVVAFLIDDGASADDANRIANQAAIDMKGAREQFEQMHERAAQQATTKLVLSVIVVAMVAIGLIALFAGEFEGYQLTARGTIYVVGGALIAPAYLVRSLANWWNIKNTTFGQYVRETYSY